jgi:hypothetical protein
VKTQSKIYLQTVPDAYIEKNYPYIVEDRSRYYLIRSRKYKEPIGLYRIRTLTYKVCEIFLSLFSEYREKLPYDHYKDIMHQTLNLPFMLDYEEIIIHTKVPAVSTLLATCKKLGVERLKTEEREYIPEDDDERTVSFIRRKKDGTQ